MPDQNGQVRVVKVKTKTGMFIRPVSKLVTLLECDKAPDSVVTSDNKVMSSPAKAQPPETKESESSKNSDLVRTRTGRLIKPKKLMNL